MGAAPLPLWRRSRHRWGGWGGGHTSRRCRGFPAGLIRHCVVLIRPAGAWILSSLPLPPCLLMRRRSWHRVRLRRMRAQLLLREHCCSWISSHVNSVLPLPVREIVPNGSTTAEGNAHITNTDPNDDGDDSPCIDRFAAVPTPTDTPGSRAAFYGVRMRVEIEYTSKSVKLVAALWIVAT